MDKNNVQVKQSIERLTDEIRKMPEDKQNLFLLLMDSMLMGAKIAEENKASATR